ncbi:hypothetical protein N0V90_007788 [Kalmusia sp. IMI 367209]|nr:hypothetical protein N0V90_007788 [Kalmusia sp. IMI 367209]
MKLPSTVLISLAFALPTLSSAILGTPSSGPTGTPIIDPVLDPIVSLTKEPSPPDVGHTCGTAFDRNFPGSNRLVVNQCGEESYNYKISAQAVLNDDCKSCTFWS